MNLRFSLSIVCCMATLAVSSWALAQESNETTKPDKKVVYPQREQPLSEVTADTTWLAGSHIRTTGGDLTMGEAKVGFSRRFVIDPKIDLSAGLKYSLREIDAPDSARLPESLHTLSLDLGAVYHVDKRLTLGVRVSPGVGSDFKGFSAGDVRVPVAVHANFQASRSLSLIGGVAYTGMNHSYPVMPVLGLLYIPSEQWVFALGFPRTGVVYKPDRKTDLYVGAEFAGGEYQLHDPPVGANVVSYRDYRAVAGVDLRVLPFAKMGIAGGYAFARKFVFYDGNRNDINLDGAPFGRVALTFTW
ncbi:DUF6268 family outer membrane beta-barrel protein [Geobacter sp. AOG2]|uniref:DUF6268 family outer membrane beta-barrel protein n=1 Tax=Geobacter sp. AOG2 TaxID=1566347 RepID=UPI001CC74C60|nr:DUF6268 family outer membrane beta-barrel protein [Geobacter sp. AOG2]GFE61974.1 hypothetical protein AOG2_25620 [Geobacter sp. AOG2]